MQPDNTLLRHAPWLQCGHEAPAGFGGSEDEGEEGATQQAQQAQQPAGSAGQPRSHKRSREEEGGEEEEQPAAAEQADEPAAAPPTAAAAAGAAQQQQDHQQPASVAAAAALSSDAAQGWRPQADLPRERKIAVGQLCKRLIDAARLRWLQRQGFEAALVKYVPSNVSGENRLLVAAVRQAAGGAA